MMCSIPGLPSPGSEIHVLITRVNLNSSYGLVELWVSMDDGRNCLYEQREKIKIPERGFFGSEGKPGDLCLVCVSNTCHRARIVSIQNETYEVFLIDQGQPLVTSREALAWAHSDSFLFPPEIEFCILANVISPESSWPEEASKFLKSLPGIKFKGLVQHVLMPERTILLDIPTVSEHMCKTGTAKKIPEDEFKCFVMKCLHLPKVESLDTGKQRPAVSCQLEKLEQYFHPELLTDMFETVHVAEVVDPQNIFCKLQIFSKGLKKLSEQIHHHYEEASDVGEVQPQACGEPCATKGLSGRWHRSLLKQSIETDNGAVEVLHVDEGKTELVPVGHIRPMHRKFLRMPVFTYLCSLDGLEGNDTQWTTDQTDYLKSLLLNKKFVARFDNHYTSASQDVYYVTFYAADSTCINNCFLEKVGLPPTPETSTPLKESICSSFLSSQVNKESTDLQNKIDANVDDLQEKTLASTKYLEVEGRMDDGPISSLDDIHIKGCSQHPNSVVHNNMPLSRRFPFEVQHGCGDDVFTVGRSINVRVSCIEGLQKFWCQSTENSHSLQLLMQDLQNHYEAPHPQPIVDSVCVARNPENNMWHRARIIASDHSPVVDVQFIDYGETQTVPLQDVCPIDPAFLQLSAQAFQCCLFSLNNSTNPKTVPSTDAAVAEFQKFVDSAATSNTGLKCIVKAITTDETGQLLNIVDIKTPSDSACKLLAQKWAQIEIQMPIPPQVQSDGYNYSTYNIEVGGKEKVRVTSSESVSHFYCQLDRNAHLLHKVMENVMQLTGQPQCRDGSLGLNSMCLVRYTDDQWHRGQIEEMSPSLKVHFVDYGDTLVVNKCDICPFPSEGRLAKSVPVQAVPLGLFGMPGEVPQEVNQWFADHAIDHSFTISVVTKGAKGKLMVELFDGALNVNVKIRERISNVAWHKMTDLTQRTNQHLSNRSQLTCVSDEYSLTKKPPNVLTELPEQSKVQTSDAVCVRDEPTMGPQSITDVSTPEIEHGKTLDQGDQQTLDAIPEGKETVLAETLRQDETKITQHSLLCGPEGNTNICPYKKPNIYQSKTEEVYASCIVGPDYFWCQYTNTEDLNTLSTLAQEAGQTKQETLSPETFGPGSPCLALFSSENQWYRAQVIKRTDNTLNVLYIDYGNESDVDINNVRSLPQNLLDKAPQAFLCKLNGFDESEGVWDDQVYEDFYSLLVDKPLRVTVLDMEDHSDVAVPQYAVEVECENSLVNNALQKYWKSVSKENFITVRHQTENSLQDGQTVSNMPHLNVSGGNANTSTYKKSKLSKNQTESVYASCIVDPGFFWCQYANTEGLKTLSLLAQEAGQTKQETLFPETFGPGSPCLALFSSDSQWYRAEVTKRTDNTLHVLYIDYGNESDVDITNVRSLPQHLLDKAPQAFLCTLNGVDESEGVWDDQVYEDFYNLLVDKPLRVTVVDVGDHSDIAVPQYAVEVECEGLIVNTLMEKYWRGPNEDPALADCLQSVDQDETRSVDQSAGV